MTALRSTCAAATLAFAVAASDTPRFAPAERTSIQKTLTSDKQGSVVEAKRSLDGREMPASDLAGMGYSTREHMKLVVTDRWVKVGDGRPIELDRSFEELLRTEKTTRRLPTKDLVDVEQKAEASDLEGATVRFSWKPAKKAYELTFAGEERDDNLLAGLREDLDARAFLPREESKPGDSWTVDGKVFAMLLAPECGYHFHEDGQDEAPADELTKKWEENLTGGGQVTFEKVRETAGRRLAVLLVEGKVAADAQLRDGDWTLKLDIQGRILWDLSANRVDTLALTGTSRIGMAGDQKIDRDGESHTQHVEMRFEGEMRLEIETKSP